MTSSEPTNAKPPANRDQASEKSPKLSPLREKIHEVIFEADTFWGMFFDVALLIAILISIVVLCLQTVDSYNSVWGDRFTAINWGFTILFTVEYLFRLYCVRKPWRYILSFWGIIDLLSFLPDYLTLGAGTSITSFSVLRSLRLLRVFRVFHLGWFEGEADALGAAIWRSRGKIVVFLATVLVIVTVAGTVMYEVEKTQPADNQFDSIPQAIYWAVVTMTTVGYGDIVPHTVAGKFVSAVVILLGYSLIIVPTGFVSAEIVESQRNYKSTRSCSACVSQGHDVDAVYCKFCGERFP